MCHFRLVPGLNSIAAVHAFCPQCGLCCNGVLFADVRLRPDEDANFFKRAGLSIRRRGKKCGFSQPCKALHADGRCGIYENRPAMCRQFECGVLQELVTGRMTEEDALREIRKAKRLAGKVSSLLENSGDRETHQPLTRRYQNVMRQPIDLNDEDGSDRRGALMLAVHELMEFLQQRFLRARPASEGNAS